MQTVISLIPLVVLAAIIILCIKETDWWRRLISRRFDGELRQERKRVKQLRNLLSAYRKKQ
ncbi:MAG: hypothetical protein HYT98_02050 [Candidatus Sungbacteria bacterium]|nr:hypothetical protein [Candidatus Sungbacteria bacterium]